MYDKRAAAAAPIRQPGKPPINFRRRRRASWHIASEIDRSDRLRDHMKANDQGAATRREGSLREGRFEASDGPARPKRGARTGVVHLGRTSEQIDHVFFL